MPKYGDNHTKSDRVSFVNKSCELVISGRNPTDQGITKESHGPKVQRIVDYISFLYVSI